MKNLFLFPLFFLFLLVSSCQQNVESPLSFVTKDIDASRIVHLEEYNILDALLVNESGDYYIFSDWSVNEGGIAILPKDLSHEAMLTGYRNNAPEGLVAPYFIKTVCDSVFVIMNEPSKMLNLSLKTGKLSYERTFSNYIGHFFDLVDSHRYISSCRPVVDSCWLFYGDFRTGDKQRVDFPKDKVINQLSSAQQSLIFMNSWVSISPDKQHFATSTSYTGIMALGTIDGETLRLTTVNNFHSPEIEKAENFSVSYSKNSVRGFRINAATDRYALFLYSPYTENNPGPEDSYNTNNILVYKWDGTHEVNLRVKEQLSFIGYDAKRNLIYGLVHNPEVQLVEYDLNGIL